MHFKRVHGIKISTRVESESCSWTDIGQTRNYTYYFTRDKQIEKATEDECPLDKAWDKVLTDFMNDTKSLLEDAKSSEIILGKVKEFMEETVYQCESPSL